MKKYQVQVSKETAEQYLEWELGSNKELINRSFGRCDGGMYSIDARGFCGDKKSYFKTKKQANEFLIRVLNASAYISGKRGDGFITACGFVFQVGE